MSHFIDLSLLKRNKNFALLWAGQSISFFGSMMARVAIPYQIYHLTRSTLMVGLVSLCQLIPLLITALYGGVLADRHHRRKLIISAEILFVFVCVLLAWNATRSTPSVTLIFIAAAISSALTGIHRPALNGIRQQLVHKNDFAAMSALNSFSRNFFGITGPVLTGFLIVHWNIETIYWIDAATFVLSVTAISCIKKIPKPELISTDSAWKSLKEGVHYAFSSPVLKGTYFVDFTAMIFGMPIALFPAMAHEFFDGPRALGLLYAAPAAGALVASIYSGWAKKVNRHGVAIACMATLWGLFIILFGVFAALRELWPTLFFLALASAADEWSGVFRDLVWNTVIPQHLYGRVSGINMISYLSGPRLGDAEAGLVAAAFGITASVISGGVLCVAGVGICCYYFPKFWHYTNQQPL